MKSFLILGMVLFFASCSQQDAPVSLPASQSQSSNLEITHKQLHKWDAIVQTLIQENPLKGEGDTFRLYAYLYYGQKLFADQSFLITNSYSGNLDLISLRIVNLFYPNYANKDIRTDPYINELTALLMKPIRRRFFEEEKQFQSKEIPNQMEDWLVKNAGGLDILKMRPWAIQSVDAFKVPKPPPQDTSFWTHQLAETRNKAREATHLQQNESKYWAGMISPDASDWRSIALAYMNEKDTSLEMQLEVRAKLMMSVIDTLIAVFHEKYTYLIKRPFMLDPNMKTHIHRPKSPSYPSAHAAVAGCVETILSYYFPENRPTWSRQAKQAAESRLWGGVHFPIDIEVGQELGQEVAKAILFPAS